MISCSACVIAFGLILTGVFLVATGLSHALAGGIFLAIDGFVLSQGAQNLWWEITLSVGIGISLLVESSIFMGLSADPSKDWSYLLLGVLSGVGLFFWVGGELPSSLNLEWGYFLLGSVNLDPVPTALMAIFISTTVVFIVKAIVQDCKPSTSSA